MPVIKDFSDGQYECSVCAVRKPLDQFSPDKNTRSGRHSRCNECKRAKDKKYQSTEKYLSRRREFEWKRRGIVDISQARYDELLLDQDEKCAICGSANLANGKSLCVDHNHDTGMTRGLLCTKCNVAIGYLNDDVEIVRKALEYLERDASKLKVVV